MADESRYGWDFNRALEDAFAKDEEFVGPRRPVQPRVEAIPTDEGTGLIGSIARWQAGRERPVEQGPTGEPGIDYLSEYGYQEPIATEIPRERVAIPEDLPYIGTPGEEVLRATERYRGVPAYGEDAVGTQRPRTAIPDEAAPAEGKGIWQWRDEKGKLQATNIKGNVPKGAKGLKFIKQEGIVTEDVDLNEARRSASIKDIMDDRDVTFQEAAKAYDESMFELTGERRVEPGAAAAGSYDALMSEYQEDVADRDSIMQNIKGLLRDATSDGEARTIMSQGAQIIKSQGLDKLKPPKRPEPTITATIEGQRVAIPVSKWKPEYGSGGKGKDTANIREAQWLINNRIATNEKEAYAMVRKATAKETTEKEWALDTRKRLNKKVDEGILSEEDYGSAYDAEMSFFRGLQGGQPGARTAIPAPASLTKPQQDAIVQRIKSMQGRGEDMGPAIAELERRGLDPRTFGL